MKTGLIGAMHEEILALKEEMDNIKETKVGSREFFEGTIGGHEVVMCLSGWGKVAAASTSSSLVNLFDVDQFVFIGLAGSLNQDLDVGDIIIADKLIQHDVDLSLLNGFDHVKSPFYKEFVFNVEKELVRYAENACKEFVDNLCKGKYPQISDQYKPQIYIGTIGTGDQFVASADGKNKITGKFPDILCTEMEGASIAQVAADYQIPCTVIRIISDKADENAHSSFADFLFSNISQISVELAKLILNPEYE